MWRRELRATRALNTIQAMKRARKVGQMAVASATLVKKEPCGRRLDFLMQELNREANTLGSKSIAKQSTQGAVNLKVLIEQMREQVQNIE